MQNSMFVDA